MRFLITGTAGFIGFHLSQRLLEAGHDVLGVDNFSAYCDVSLKEGRNGILERYVGFRAGAFRKLGKPDHVLYDLKYLFDAADTDARL